METDLTDYDTAVGTDGAAAHEATPGVVHAFLLGDLVPFPSVVFPLVLDDEQERRFFEAAQEGGGYVAFFNREVLEREGGGSRIGVIGRMLKTFRLPDGRTSVVMQCYRRVEFVRKVRVKPFLIAKVSYPRDIMAQPAAIEATRRQVKNKLEELVKSHPGIPEEMQLAAVNIEEPARLADFVGQNFVREKSERLQFLHTLSVAKRLDLALERLIKDLELLKVGNKISDDIQKKVETHQRQFYLREQLRAIRKELGEEQDPKSLELEQLKKKLDAQELPKVVRDKADDEIRRLQVIPVESPEHAVIRNYLDWISDLPWSHKSDDINDLNHAERVLQEDHFGLKEIKERILEFLAIRKLNPARRGGIICFIGPPGVGKTSLGRSIAKALGRKFYRFSLGGMRDEAEIKGHRRTYVGAMPGRILQGMKFLGVKNPVFMLDEIDKMGRDFRGDPASAMLEVLDPEQNTTFLDHYLDLPFDLSQALFICTANVKSDIPGPLLDRMEIIELSGYIPEEKIEIASRYLLPKQITEHGLKSSQVKINKQVLGEIVDHYTREAGVRGLEREVAKVCRKIAFSVAKGKKAPGAIVKKDLVSYLGPEKVERDMYEKPRLGVALGLAWTPVGGDVLFIESRRVRGTGKLTLTGQIGNVMNESAHLAMTLLRAQQEELKLPEKFFSENDFHLHFPAGAVPKDGPSAGITIYSALYSLLSGMVLRPYLAMTGEVTLRGEVLAIGGLREKVVAARRAGLRMVMIPEKNVKDLEEIPDYVKKGVKFIPVSTIAEVIAAGFRKT